MRLILILLTLAWPAALAAQSTCAEKHQAQTCAEGYVWDVEAGSCVQQITS
ncbi:hypothetical protein [Pseudooceanicola sp.]|uniref:hypothetical protein n=1 Tax=Pseudooceanicola sp. TaxID=1914328 RepID=UPI002619C8E6|nr:hypothetical protein [Pseudooceanicola sp.]MDF1854867.1 hypothetical protein [Pseudooceanicola sp.]